MLKDSFRRMVLTNVFDAFVAGQNSITLGSNIVISLIFDQMYHFVLCDRVENKS